MTCPLQFPVCRGGRFVLGSIEPYPDPSILASWAKKSEEPPEKDKDFPLCRTLEIHLEKTKRQEKNHKNEQKKTRKTNKQGLEGQGNQSQKFMFMCLFQCSFVYPYPHVSDLAGGNSDHGPRKTRTKTQTSPDSVFTREGRNSDHGLSFWGGKTQTMV